MNCKSCIHWKPKEYHHNIGECVKPHPWWERTEWVDIDNVYDRQLKLDAKDDQFWVQDGSDYKAHLYTRDDFYCAAFEEKP